MNDRYRYAVDDDYLQFQMHEDSRAREDIVVVFVVLAVVSLFIGVWLGKLFYRGRGDRMAGAAGFALIVGSVFGGFLGLVAARVTQLGMAFVGATVLGLTAAQWASPRAASTKFVFAAIWAIGGVALLATVMGEPAMKSGALQLLGITGIGIGIVHAIRGASQASAKPESYEEKLAQRSKTFGRRRRAKGPSFACVYCRAGIPYRTDQAGQDVRCRKCRLISIAPALQNEGDAELGDAPDPAGI